MTPLAWPEGHSGGSRSFHKKHLNIVDPLKASNNLGRSVSKGTAIRVPALPGGSSSSPVKFLGLNWFSRAGNSYRIRSAFAYGARKLGRILALPRERIAEELGKFFMNSLDHGDAEQLHEEDASPSATGSAPSGTSGREMAFGGDEAQAQAAASKTGPSPRRVFHAPHQFFCRGDESSMAARSERQELAQKGEEGMAAGGRDAEPSPFSDLTGDYDAHMKNLQYALCCLERQPSSSFHARHQQEALPRPGMVHAGSSSWVFQSPFHPAPGYYGSNGHGVHCGYGPDNLPRARGTGPYIPNMVRLLFICSFMSPPSFPLLHDAYAGIISAEPLDAQGEGPAGERKGRGSCRSEDPGGEHSP